MSGRGVQLVDERSRPTTRFTGVVCKSSATMGEVVAVEPPQGALPRPPALTGIWLTVSVGHKSRAPW